MDTRQLRIFAAVYRTRSFTRAAAELFTSQPTISEHMRNLEEHLGCRLFDRLGRSIMPTPQADLLYPKTVEILNEIDKISTMLATVTNEVSGEIHLGASTIPGEYILPQYAASFKNRFPGVSFQITIGDSTQVIERISNNRLYMGFVGVRIPAKNVEYAPFGNDELVLAAHKSANIPDEITTAELPGLNFLLRESGSGTGKNIEIFLARHNIKTSELEVSAVLGSSTAIKEAIKSGLGVSIISRLAIQDELKCGMLREIRVKGLQMKRDFYIARAAKRTIPNHYLAFADSLNP
ncbi:MAG: selenium metabolism-associated LysR family transcriptional regulator [Desulfocapsaceae bacterium]|jgi:DNA-binding transcriptional LysR family regulator|nr:selenium metabolism-associated LysR family transcriptional regulator [Desulfocapsaceae bacterium]